MNIELSPDFSIDAGQTATQTISVVGAKRSGKTYLVTKLVEGLYAAGVPFVVFDPVGVWSGLTLAADGKGPGLAVVVIGGVHGDVPLDAEQGDRLGTYLVSAGLQVVVDISQLSKRQRKVYVADVCEALFREASTTRRPFTCVFEEAQLLAPQKPLAGEERMLGAITDIVRLGGNYGLGSVMITQRPQSVSKEVLSQTELLLVGCLRGPHEKKAIAEWIVHELQGAHKDVIADLPGLERGEFCAFSPSWLRIFKRIRVSPKATFDASSTPVLGAAKRELGTSPKREVLEVVRSLVKLFAPAEKREPQEGSLEAAEDAVQMYEELESLRSRGIRAEEENASLWSRVRTHEAREAAIRRALTMALEALDSMDEPVFVASVEQRQKLRADPQLPIEPWGESALDQSRDKPAKPRPAPEKRASVAELQGGDPALDKPGRAVLAALAQHGGQLPRRRLAMLAGYSPTSGSFRNCLSRLRVAEWIEGSDLVVLTRAGRAASPRAARLPTGAALVEFWAQHPRMDTPMRSIYGVLVERDEPVDRARLATLAGYSEGSGSFRNALARLRVLGVVEGKGKAPISLAPVLAEAASAARRAA